MAPVKVTEPVLVETSETELISGTESFSDHFNAQRHKVDKSLSLEELFKELNRETHSGVKLVEDEDEFKKIQKSISSLPKIESNLEKNMKNQIANSQKNKDVVRINDPITYKANKNTSKDSVDSGSKWFNMKQQELTPEVKRDLLIVKQRSALDPKRHYKKEKWEIPKYFQMGTIIEGNTEFYSSRMSKRTRGSTLTEEILKDGDSNKYFKRKYAEIQESKTSGRKNHYKKIKDMRKRY